MADVVASVLEAVAEKEAQFKPIDVKKDIEIDCDIGNLLAIDHNPIELKRYRTEKDAFLISLARDNTQLLINKIWELKTERVEETVVAILPLPTTLLSREKPIPKGRIETKWSKYARLKGILKKKKSRMVWDDEQKKWLPRWGYKRSGDIKNDWVLEVPETADPYEDQFEKKTKARKERVAKNELQRLRNIARTSKGKFKGTTVGVLPNETRDKNQLSRALTEARRSTASVGRFTDQLPKEKPEKGQGKKRKFESNFGSPQTEKKNSLEILGKITNKQPIMDTDKAANKQIAAEDRSRAASKSDVKGKGAKRGRKGGRGPQRQADITRGASRGGRGGSRGGSRGSRGGSGGSMGGSGGSRGGRGGSRGGRGGRGGSRGGRGGSRGGRGGKR